MSWMFSHHTTGLHTTQIVYAPCNFQIMAGSPPATSFLFNMLIKQHLPQTPEKQRLCFRPPPRKQILKGSKSREFLLPSSQRSSFHNTVRVCARLLSQVRLFVTTRSASCPAPLSMGRILEWVAMPFSRGSSRPRD